MSRRVMKCPECGHQETVMSSRPGAENPPCPRCEKMTRMEDVTPDPGQTTQAWSASGSKAVEAPPPPPPAPLPDRGMGPEPRN